MFSRFAKSMAGYLGHTNAFIAACLLIFFWMIAGPIFEYSDSWEIVINTITTIITFLMVFLLQNSQNRDTLAIHLKLDEIIRSTKHAHNELLKIEQLSDEDLDILLKKYETLAADIRSRKQRGESDLGVRNFDHK